jgi:hypothetical protein
MLPSSEDLHAPASTTAVDRFDNVHDFPRFCNIRMSRQRRMNLLREFTAARSGGYALEPGADRVRQIFVSRRISIRIVSRTDERG